MLNLIVSGARVSYDSLEEAKDAARESELAFWRETLTECAENEAMWNEFLNDLWQSGAEDEAERLDCTFPKDAPRHWLLVAVTLGSDDPWVAFLAEWEAQGDERILSAVSSHAFAPWLKQVQPKKHDLLVRAFGADAAKWPNDLLLKALKAEGTEAEIAEWKAVVEKRKEPKPGDEMTITLPGGVPMTFCWCPATTSEAWKKISGGKNYFLMGSPVSEEERRDYEKLHRVTLTQGFWMGKYEVTQRQWESVMGQNPSDFEGADHPVEHVTWDACQDFVRKINATDRVHVSLPTEAQWEYACRAGTPGDYAGELESMGWYDGNSGFDIEPHRVGQKNSNAWNLYDMHGNVREWCQDWFGAYEGDSTDPTGPTSGIYRVNRGGCILDYACKNRSAARGAQVPDLNVHLIGLRLVCSLP